MAFIDWRATRSFSRRTTKPSCSRRLRQVAVERRVSEEGLLPARPGGNDLRAPRCPDGLCGFFALSAHAVHEAATVHLLGREQIVYVTEKPDPSTECTCVRAKPST